MKTLLEVRHEFLLNERVACEHAFHLGGGAGAGGALGFMFAGYAPLASQSPYPIVVYFLANYRPHLSYFLENVIFAIPT